MDAVIQAAPAEATVEIVLAVVVIWHTLMPILPTSQWEPLITRLLSIGRCSLSAVPNPVSKERGELAASAF